ncbi:acylphosphatase [Candidatus Dependentiae bacterium]|nr:acylphosphatase [Candidatus Dependentiae bacterium]
MKGCKMKRCVKIRVIGKVQAVGYRHFIQNQAEKLMIEGTIQNQHDGSVIIFVCGGQDKLDDLLDFIYQGSPKSKVDDVLIEPMQTERDFRGVFRVIGDNL